MDKAIGFLLAGVLGVFFGIQIIGAAIILWPITLIVIWWNVKK